MVDAVAPKTNQSRAKVFISYSRKDMIFADRLDAALKARGFEPLIDRTDIYAFEEWWKRVEVLITRADTVVFVLSPDAVKPGTVALKEVSFAASLNKRFAPVVFHPVEDKTVPEELARLNFIFFDDDTRFEHNADQLAEALNIDIAWIRQHTDFGEQARRWGLAKNPSGLLLRPPMLEEAEHWIAARPAGAPVPTGETQAFIAESRRRTTRRRNVLTGGLCCLRSRSSVSLFGSDKLRSNSNRLQIDNASSQRTRYPQRPIRPMVSFSIWHSGFGLRSGYVPPSSRMFSIARALCKSNSPRLGRPLRSCSAARLRLSSKRQSHYWTSATLQAHSPQLIGRD
jgi:hypothetical protein